MRTYGEIGGVSFRLICFSIYNLANEYKLYDGINQKTVYVNSMKELKDEIQNFIKGLDHGNI